MTELMNTRRRYYEHSWIMISRDRDEDVCTRCSLVYGMWLLLTKHESLQTFDCLAEQERTTMINALELNGALIVSDRVPRKEGA